MAKHLNVEAHVYNVMGLRVGQHARIEDNEANRSLIEQGYLREVPAADLKAAGFDKASDVPEHALDGSALPLGPDGAPEAAEAASGTHSGHSAGTEG